jgi:hypothetical protein
VVISSNPCGVLDSARKSFRRDRLL